MKTITKYLLIFAAVVSTTGIADTHPEKVVKAATNVNNVHIRHVDHLLSFIKEHRLDAHIAKKYNAYSKNISERINLEIVKKVSREDSDFYTRLKIKVGFRIPADSTMAKKQARKIAKYGLKYVHAQIRLAIKLFDESRTIAT